MVAVGGAANFSRVSSAVEVSSMFVPALSELGWTRTEIASATTIGGVGAALAGPIVGHLLDKFGARVIVPCGASIVGLGCLALGASTSVASFIILYAIVRAAGQALVMFPNSVSPAIWFERRKGAATAVTGGIGAIGLITMPVVVQAVIASSGIAWAWITLGILALALGVLPSALLLARRPEDLGLLPDGEPQSTLGHDTEKNFQGHRNIEQFGLSEASRTSAFWAITLMVFGISAVVTGVSFHQLAYYIERGITPTVAATVVSSYALGITVGGVVWGWLGDRYSVRWLLLGIYVLMGLDILFLTSVVSPAGAYPFAFIFGALIGGALALPTLLLATYYGRRSLGSIAGFVQMSRSFGLGAGPLIGGALYDSSASYDSAFLTFVVICVVSVFLVARFGGRPALMQ